MWRPLRTLTILVATVAVAVTTASPVSAQQDGGEPARPTAVVSLGDSYISGEAGRWVGNHRSSFGSRGGTDRAAYRRGWWWRYDASRIYGPTDRTGCHRSDVAPIEWVDTADVTINLACSGAATANIISAANGGRSHRGEAPQADQLARVAADHDVTVVVLSIGGNDLGFGDIILDCTVEYLTSPSWWPNFCHGEQQDRIDAAMPAAMAGVRQSIADIRAALAAAGDDDHRIIVQSYVSPVARGSAFRYRESGWSRITTGGCPFWNADADWARDPPRPPRSPTTWPRWRPRRGPSSSTSATPSRAARSAPSRPARVGAPTPSGAGSS